MDSDFIKIPVYEGEYGSEDTRAIYNEHVTDIRISGADLPSLLPANSDVDLTVNIDRSEKITVTAYFPYLEYTHEVEAKSFRESIKTEWLSNEIRKAKGSIAELKQDGNSEDNNIHQIESKIIEIEKSFDNNKNDVDNQKQVISNLRKSLKEIDELNETTEWPKLEESLKEEFYRLEKVNNELGNESSTQVVNQFRSELDKVIRVKDVKLGNVLLEEISGFFVQLTLIYQLINFIKSHNELFGSYNWKDSTRARTLLNKGLQIIGENPDVAELHPVVISLIDLLPDDERPSGDDSVLVG